MASPTVEARRNTADSADATSHTVMLPNGSNVTGKLLVASCASNGIPTFSWPAGWTELYDVAGTTVVRGSVAYHQVNGTEGYDGTDDSIVVTTSASEKVASKVHRITGHEDPGTRAPEAGTAANGSNANPDPPSISPTGGSKDYLFIAVSSNTNTTLATAAPTNYINLETHATSGGSAATNAVLSTAERAATVSTEDPGVFTLAGSRVWVANVIAIHPSSAGGPVEGAAASVVNVTSAADGDVAVQGSADSQVRATSAADGDVAVQGAAAFIVNVTQTADGDVAVRGAAASVVQAQSAADGDTLVQGAAASSAAVTQAATGTVVSGPSGAAASQVQVTQAADGDVEVRGAAASQVAATQSASGAVPVQGAAASTIGVTQEATGTAGSPTIQGSAASVANVTLAADGDVLVQGAAVSLVGAVAVVTGTAGLVVSVPETLAESRAWWHDQQYRAGKVGLRLYAPRPAHENEEPAATRFARWLDGLLD